MQPRNKKPRIDKVFCRIYQSHSPPVCQRKLPIPKDKSLSEWPDDHPPIRQETDGLAEARLTAQLFTPHSSIFPGCCPSFAFYSNDSELGRSTLENLILMLSLCWIQAVIQDNPSCRSPPAQSQFASRSVAPVY